MSLSTDKTLFDFMVNLCQHAALVCTNNTHKAYQYLHDAHVNTLNSGSIYEFTGGEYTWTCRVLDLIEPCIRVKLTRGEQLIFTCDALLQSRLFQVKLTQTGERELIKPTTP